MGAGAATTKQTAWEDAITEGGATAVEAGVQKDLAASGAKVDERSPCDKGHSIEAAGANIEPTDAVT